MSTNSSNNNDNDDDGYTPPPSIMPPLTPSTPHIGDVTDITTNPDHLADTPIESMNNFAIDDTTTTPSSPPTLPHDLPVGSNEEEDDEDVDVNAPLEVDYGNEDGDNDNNDNYSSPFAARPPAMSAAWLKREQDTRSEWMQQRRRERAREGVTQTKGDR